MLPQSWTHQTDYEAGARRPAVTPEAPTPFWTAARRAARDQIYNSNDGGRETYWQGHLLERHREIERITGQRLDFAEDMGRTDLGSDALYSQIEDPYARGTAHSAAQQTRLKVDAYEARIDALRQQFPDLANVPTRVQLRERSTAGLTNIRQTAQKDADSGAAGAVGGFIGGSGAAMLDLPNLAIGAATGGVGAGRPMLMRLGAQAIANAAGEVAQVPHRATSAQIFGGPQYSPTEAVGDVIGAAAGAAGMELVMDAGRWVWRRAARQMSSSSEPLERGVADRIETLMDDEEILANAPDFDEARGRLDRGDLPPIVEPDQELDDLFGPQVLRSVAPSQPENAGGLIAAEYMGRQIWSGRFDPLQVEADAARFQYKGEGDGDGVTSRLRGVERWDTTASGKALLFEDTDGRIYVADGHQRRGLARRLAEQGWEDAQLDGYLFRAADGWTDRQVRVVAALKNIREGSGSIMDAAKLFREAPQAIKDRSLPVTGDFIHQARQLASLSDAAFRAVTNEVIPARYGAVIGEVAGDRPDLQGDMVELLRRADPGSTDGARALLHEAMLDDFIASEGVQADLFGGLPRESTVIARGKIRESVMRALRKDQRTFAGLVKNADAVEAGGNILARNENEARLALDRSAQELVSRLSLRSGDIGEAFADAAGAVTRGELSAAEAAKGLTQRIRNAVKSGELLEMERKATLDPDPPSEAALKHARAFDEPAGAGQKAQLEPKPEDAGLETAPLATEPVATLKGDELGQTEGRSWPEVVRMAVAKLQSMKGSVDSAALGRPVSITNAGINKATRSAPKEVIEILPAIQDILAKGRLVGSEPDRYGRPNVKALHTLSAVVRVGDQDRAVVAIVREDNNGNIWWGLFKDDGRHMADDVQGSAIQRVGPDDTARGDRDPNMTAVDEELNLRVEEPEEAPPPGLFDDLFNDAAPEQRALDVLAQCAPGGR